MVEFNRSHGKQVTINWIHKWRIKTDQFVKIMACCLFSATPFPTSILMITIKQRQNGHHFAYDILQLIFFNEDVWILIQISQKFVHKAPINNKPTLVEITDCCWKDNKPLFKPMMSTKTVASLYLIDLNFLFWFIALNHVTQTQLRRFYFLISCIKTDWESLRCIFSKDTYKYNAQIYPIRCFTISCRYNLTRTHTPLTSTVIEKTCKLRTTITRNLVTQLGVFPTHFFSPTILIQWI